MRLQLFALAYNLGNFLRRLALPRSVRHRSLTTIREKLIKICAKVVRHAKYVAFQMAEVAPAGLDTWQTLRAGLETPRHARTLRQRFRRDPEAYLRQLKALLLKQTLPP